MARRYKTDPEVKELILAISKLYTAQNSMAGLSALLSEGITIEDRRFFHPNRLKPLLDGNISTSLNDRTFSAIQKRIAEMDLSQHADNRYIDTITESYKQLIVNNNLPEDAVKHVAQAFKAPEGLIKALCETETASRSLIANDIADKWAWQDEAVEKTRQEIVQNKGKNIGLIVPTGGGKTRITCEVILELLQSNEVSSVTWVAHRLNLLNQAEGTFIKLLRQKFSSKDQYKKFLDRIKFKMIGKVLEQNLTADSLLVIDEAHHASAGSYQRLIKSACTNLLLTATPKRMDEQPIGLDKIAFQTTYKKLFEFGCVVEPDFFKFSPMNSVSPFENEESLKEFAEYILDNLSNRDQKSLVCVIRKDDVERLYIVLRELITIYGHDYLTVDDIYYVHGDKNSSDHMENEEFFNECAQVQNGILISTSSLISEGFDDPIIDSVYVTYPSKSISHLMQTAGRALRYHEDKNHAAVIQVRSNQLEYFFEKRWLYQDISDRFRPQLVDIEYSDPNELVAEVERALKERCLNVRNHDKIIEQISDIEQGKDFRLFLIGLPYSGTAENFSLTNQYKALLLQDEDEIRFIEDFNRICETYEIEDSKSFLINILGINSHELINSFWFDIIHACQKAKLEVNLNKWGNRGHTPELGTTWLVNISVEYKIDNEDLLKFLSDCVNKEKALSEYNASQTPMFVVKFEEPFKGYKAFCLNQIQFEWIADYLKNLRNYLLSNSGFDAWTLVTQFNNSLPEYPVPVSLLQMLPILTRQDRYLRQVFRGK